MLACFQTRPEHFAVQLSADSKAFQRCALNWDEISRSRPCISGRTRQSVFLSCVRWSRVDTAHSDVSPDTRCLSRLWQSDTCQGCGTHISDTQKLVAASLESFGIVFVTKRWTGGCWLMRADQSPIVGTTELIHFPLH